jgi:hypothetical protein
VISEWYIGDPYKISDLNGEYAQVV